MHLSLALSLLLTGGGLLACGDKDDDTGGATDGGATDGGGGTGGGTGGEIDVYDFDSAFTDGSSVSYSGQVFRHLLIDDMKSHLGGVTGRIDDGSLFPVAGDVRDELLFYFEFDSSTSGSVEILKSTSSPAVQEVYDDVSSGKNLVEKLAGNDVTGQHEDWTTDFVGWQAPGVTTPESLVRHWIDLIDQQAVDRASGDIPLDPSGAALTAVHLTAEGQDLQQLLEKFLRGAVAFSQGADDYLDDDIEGKGLRSDHTAAEEGEPFTALEHAWDEGFGYFGAARSWAAWSDADTADLGSRDDDGDGQIDLLTEVCWGHSTNAAKRDVGSAGLSATDFTGDAWQGFRDGRALLADTAGQGLTADQLATLQGHRDLALSAWEAAIAASVVHYINAVLQDMSRMGTADYSFEDHAKHWSEGKGFALSLQFNRLSPLSDADFAALHTLLGMAPVLQSGAAAEAYAQDLRDARALLGETYGFATENLGGDDGTGGW